MYVMQLRNTSALPVFKFAPDCSAGYNSTPPDPAALSLITRSGYALVVPFTIQPYESYQAPLYYLSAALLAAPLAPDDALGTLYAARLLSTILAVITVLIAAHAFLELTGRRDVAIGAAALMASIPTFGFFGGIANNDNMLNLFAATTALASIT